MSTESGAQAAPASPSSDAGSGMSNTEFFERVAAFIRNRPRGVGRKIVHILAISAGTRLIANAGNSLAKTLEEDGIDPRIIERITAGFNTIGAGSNEINEGGELARAYYERLAQALRETGGRVPNRQVMEEEREAA